MYVQPSATYGSYYVQYVSCQFELPTSDMYDKSRSPRRSVQNWTAHECKLYALHTEGGNID